ncbi:transthyretin-like family protein [Blastopirellula retiformator]|uniref:Carboxypeptidase regulatory-like domain-containing protein n=1 Tax=Blastopirellula retiformator TaxID=2527970 RepID=A0A5C5UWT3_9BACT|nr:hypothetical protein [Blastopirellula retiformator]TWT30017.1 hypothetical protein Enr8_46740 [Blastopirellula retiformator]
MKSKQAGRLAVALSVILLGLPGCGGPSDQPDLGRVHGTITIDGTPLSGVVVVFQPESGRPAHGRTDANGQYELTYIRDTRGTKVGRNRVEIAPSEEEDEPAQDESDTEEVQRSRPTKSGKPRIPARYNIKSELEADVQPGDNTFDFELTSKTGRSRR